MLGFTSNLPLTLSSFTPLSSNLICSKSSSPVRAHIFSKRATPARMVLTSEGDVSEGNIAVHSRQTIADKRALSQAFSVTTMDQFWQLADESKLNSQYDADDKIEFLKTASLDELRQVCLQYRYFVERYPDNLSYLVHKLPNIQLKSLLAEILSEELGSGKISGSHVQWYDRFLLSIGVTEEELQASLYCENEAVLSEIARGLRTSPFEYGIGMVGMGGECLCQIYLTVMHKNLMMNPNLQNYKGKIDWLFWTYHIGEEDIEHRRMVRACIDELGLDADGVNQLARGYAMGKETWDRFWSNNYMNTRLFTSHASKN